VRGIGFDFFPSLPKSLQVETFVILKIHGLLVDKIKKLVNEEKPFGMYSKVKYNRIAKWSLFLQNTSWKFY
jgi:hypothetical protein